MGTTFNFKDQAADGKEVISLIEGRLEVTGLNGEGKGCPSSQPKGYCQQGSKTIKTENSYALADAVWRDDIIPFNNMRINEIAKILEQLYDYKIIVDAKVWTTQKLTQVNQEKQGYKKMS